MEDNMSNNNNMNSNGGEYNNGGSPPPLAPPPQQQQQQPPMCRNCGCQRRVSFPPGYKFNPTDEELVDNYLKKKVMSEPLPFSDFMQTKIVEVNLYKRNPWDLAEQYNPGSGEKEWYFFTPRDRKYRNGNRPNRAAGDGYWKATGADKAVKKNEVIVGYRKALVFYKGKPPKGDKTNWIMHEFRFNAPARKRKFSNDMRLDDWVLCRIYKKNESAKPKSKEEETTENDDATVEQSAVEAAFDENQIQHGGNNDDHEDLTETDGNVADERFMNHSTLEQQQPLPPPNNPYVMYHMPSVPPSLQGGSLANYPFIRNAHFPQCFEDKQNYIPGNETNYGFGQQPPPPPPPLPTQMVPPDFQKHPSLYTQMSSHSNMMFRENQLRRQYDMDSKPRGLVTQRYPQQQYQPQQHQQYHEEFDFKDDPLQAYLVDDKNMYKEVLTIYNSDYSKDGQNNSAGTTHDPSFNQEGDS